MSSPHNLTHRCITPSQMVVYDSRVWRGREWRRRGREWRRGREGGVEELTHKSLYMKMGRRLLIQMKISTMKLVVGIK